MAGLAAGGLNSFLFNPKREKMQDARRHQSGKKA
jgi:hypothetical protein